MKILHIVSLAWKGGVNAFILDFKKAFEEFQHEVLFTSDVSDNYKVYQDFQTKGIRCYYNDNLTDKLFEKINPKIIILHNPRPEKLKDLKILQKFYTIQIYHNKCKIFPNIDLHIFVSDWVKDAYKGWEKFIQKSKVVHPCVDAEPYLNIERCYNKLQNVTVGRIQSNTNNFRGKFSEDVGMLKKLKNANFFLVGDGYEKTSDERFTYAPMGNMVNYLKRIDIFYIWGGKGHVESWSRVVSEALLSNLPVVVKNNHDGLSEQAKKSGVVYLVNNEKEFIKTIQMLIDNPKLRERKGKEGREWARNNVSLKQLREGLIDEMLQFATN